MRDVLEYYERTEGMQHNLASQHYEQRLAELEESARPPSAHVQRPFQKTATPSSSFTFSNGGATEGGARVKNGVQSGADQSRTLHAHRNRSELAGSEGADSTEESSLASPVRSEESFDVASAGGSRLEGVEDSDHAASIQHGGDRSAPNEAAHVDTAGDLSADDEELEL